MTQPLTHLKMFFCFSSICKQFIMGKVVGGVIFNSEADGEQTIYSDCVIRLQSYGHS